MVPRFFSCSNPGCAKTNVRGFGGCDFCNLQFCGIHRSLPFHKVGDLSGLAPGCGLESILRTQFSRVSDYATYVAHIVAEIGRLQLGCRESLAGYLVRSEYATLKFLETTAVPAPRAFGFGVHGAGTDHGVGLSFLLMEELPGKSWPGDGIDGRLASEEDKARVLRGLADILTELATHPFPKAGSLTPQGSDIQVSEYLALIADGQLHTEYPVDAYLVYRFLKDNAAQLVQREGDIQEAEEIFYLKHVDDKGGHLLVDDDLNITGPFNEAIGPSLVTADMSLLCNGRVSLSDDDVALARVLKQRSYFQLPACKEDDKIRCFFWGLALESKWSYALPLANAIPRVFGVDPEWNEWREGALEEYMSDERLQGLLARARSAVP
ncbi:hypothetical protein PpBr36_02395 [Pyricularia pennisetigena]|uniref:hypothetical protein n=1 Tax=Pyricularia pennisetigena TaxID=1578925 RepID=UPI00114EB0A3|nr:hypothetical protein PpBr36_02395 [Pyricularia pennisetigena]TLS31438.1 hypothetical protein PpBr36_02395 [Pyricularia pennisetigena]